MATLNMDTITEIIRRAGTPAYVEHTGGGVATIYVGSLVPDEDGVSRYSALAGPGWFGDDAAYGDTADFYVGPDDDGEDIDAFYAATDSDTEQTIAARALAYTGTEPF